VKRDRYAVALVGAALAMAPTDPPPRRSTWDRPKNYSNERKREKAEKAAKAARKSRQRNRR
jgi:hypothetical protein